MRIAALITALLLTSAATAAPLVPKAPRYKQGQTVAATEYASEWRWVQAKLGVSGLPMPPMVMAGNILPVLGRSHDVRGLSFGRVVVLDERDHDDADLIQRSMVLHELVHQAQYAMGLSGCGLERDAYRLQNEWLAERGLPAYVTAEQIEWAVRKCEGG